MSPKKQELEESDITEADLVTAEEDVESVEPEIEIPAAIEVAGVVLPDQEEEETLAPELEEEWGTEAIEDTYSNLAGFEDDYTGDDY